MTGMRSAGRLLALFVLLFAAAGARAAFDWKKKLKAPPRTHSSKQPVGAAAVRGLDEPGSPGDVDARDHEAVAWMEARGIDTDDVSTFAVTGGLEP